MSRTFGRTAIGLLGLAVFLNFMNLPRSASMVGGLVLTLMTLPTIIIASRASLKSVPPSIREAALGVGAQQQVAAQGLAAPDRAHQRLDLVVAVAQGAGTQVAAVERITVAQHDVERTGDGVAAAVGRGRTDDLDALHQLGRDAVDEEAAAPETDVE